MNIFFKKLKTINVHWIYVNPNLPFHPIAPSLLGNYIVHEIMDIDIQCPSS